MNTKVIGEQQVQILSPNFSISPSNEDYVLNISANGRDFSPLFAVSAGVTRLVSNVAPGSYYKLVGNQSEVVINWQRMCATEGGGSFDPSVLEPYWTSAQTMDYVDGAVSGISVDLSDYYTSAQTEDAIADELSAYWTSAETQDAIDEKTAKLFTKDAPIMTLSEDNINAFFGDNSAIYLLDITNGYYNDNPFDGDSEFSGHFIIDKENKEFYIENVPAGIYRIGVKANNVEDQTLTFKVWIDGEEIETNTTKDLPYAVDGWMAILSNGTDYQYANWSLDADAERITFKYDEENVYFEVNYKPTIEEALSAYTPTSGFSTINGSAITNGGNIVIQGGADMSAYYTSAQTEDAISAATSGKADAVSVTPYSNRCLFPKWNSQGIITGVYKEATNRSVKVNGSTFHFYSSEGFDLPAIYSPANAGTAGDILVSTGGRPVWSAVTFPDVSNYVTSAQVETQIVEKNYITSADTANMVQSTTIRNIVSISQAGYDALPTKDANTFYVITGTTA